MSSSATGAPPTVPAAGTTVTATSRRPPAPASDMTAVRAARATKPVTSVSAVMLPRPAARLSAAPAGGGATMSPVAELSATGATLRSQRQGLPLNPGSAHVPASGGTTSGCARHTPDSAFTSPVSRTLYASSRK